MYIHVKVTTGAKDEGIKLIKDLHYIVTVKEKAERNQANKRVCELVANLLGTQAKAIRIISGHHSPSKLLSVPDQK